MDPLTAAMLVSAAGSAMKAVGAVSEGQSQADAYKYEARVAKQNAQMASAQATAKADQIRRDGRQVQGAQAASIAESGTGFTGSNLDIYRQDAAKIALDAMNIRYGGEVERTNYMNQAAALKVKAKNARTAGYMGAGSAVLEGVGNYLGSSGKLKKGSG